MAKLQQIDNREIYLVTGAAGFIGFHLSMRLLDMGCQVVGVDNLNPYYDVNLKESRLQILEKYPRFTFVKVDLSDTLLLETVFTKFRPAVVIHLAAQAGVRYSLENPKAYIQSNIVGFFNVLEGCRRLGVNHLVYASSSSVYGNQSKTPFSVADNVSKPVSLYAATKTSNELMAYAYSYLYDIPATGLRFFTVYGPYGRPDMAYFQFTEKIYNGAPIKIFNNGDMKRDFTYIDDIVKGLERIIPNPSQPDEQNAKHRVYNLGNSKPENLMDFIEALETCIGIKAQKEFCPMQAGDVYQTYADMTDCENDFDFRIETSIRSGLSIFVRWYREYYGITHDERTLCQA